MGSRRLAWIASEQGQKWVFAGAGCVGFGLFTANIVPHTFLLNKYKEIIQMYRFGIAVPVSQNVLNLVDEVMDDMNIPQQKRKMIQPFTIFGFDVFHAGTTTSKYGAIIGLPSAFEYQSVENVDCHNILVKNEKVNWQSKDGGNLQAALSMSKNAKKFAIGKEIAMCENIQPILNAFYPVSVFLVVYMLTHKLTKRLELFNRPFALRGILYSIVGLFGFGVWAFLKDYTNVYYESQADKRMCGLHKDYMEGGLEFYVKTLQRNIALRNLMGRDGEKLFSASGNDLFFIRQKRLPLVYRKSYFEIRLQENKSE